MKGFKVAFLPVDHFNQSDLLAFARLTTFAYSYSLLAFSPLTTMQIFGILTSMNHLKQLCEMIKIHSDFADKTVDYFDEMKAMFATIPILQNHAHNSDMIRNLGSIDDNENLKFPDKDVFESTNIGNESYFKSKRSVAQL